MVPKIERWPLGSFTEEELFLQDRLYEVTGNSEMRRRWLSGRGHIPNQGTCMRIGLGLERTATHGEQQEDINQIGAYKSSFQNPLDPPGFLLINTTMTSETSVNAFSFQLFLLIFGCRTSIFSGSSLDSLFNELHSCCCPVPLPVTLKK